MKLPSRLLVLGLVLSLVPQVMAAERNTNFFPIMAWNHVPNDPAVLNRMREAGLTVAGFAAPGTLDACHAAGLMAIVSDPRCAGYDWQNVDGAQARTNIASLVAEVGRHPALFGYYLRDEPHAALFPGLAKVSDLIREMSPGKWPYINLFPDYATPEQLGTSNYTEYLERFVSVCHPTIMSYDNYSLMDDGTVRDYYWTNLESMRSVSLEHKLDFWNIILAVAHFNYRELNDADFRFQVYTTLAYGGRGISYFTYFAPPVGNYRNAAIDQFGNETPTWHSMQYANLQVLQLAQTVLQLTSDDVYHIGKLPPGCHGPTTNSLVTAVSGDNAVVGEFTHRDGSRYVMIVNKDVKKSRVCEPKFRKAPAKVMRVSPYSGGLISFEGEQVWIAPGGGILLKLD